MSQHNVLFVCLGNICRSPMAEALARAYGSDVIRARSAGLTPAISTSPLTRTVLKEKNIELGDHLPRSIRDISLDGVDLIVNMSGRKLPVETAVPILDWKVKDPIGGSQTVYQEVCAQLEMLVMQLILQLRTGKFDYRATARAK
ncbi:MAG TPA: low molecular weight phosphatase family protein [Bryobacteraceae bacterium]|nr:low molecular weight phosphatase family protein [Bryobacteraceae bacterium]